MEYLPESLRALQTPSTNYIAKSPTKAKRSRSATPAAPATPKRIFQFDDELNVLLKERGVYFDDLNFGVALKSQEKTSAARRSGRNRCAAPVFQSNLR